LEELDALIGTHITGEEPARHWEDAQGCFRFDTEAEARQALEDPYFQQFLPQIDWHSTEVQLVNEYRPYASNHALAWEMVERFIISATGAIAIHRDRGFWVVTVTDQPASRARTIPVALCVAALQLRGIQVEIAHDRIDHKMNNGEPPKLPYS
jgi:hypothetical protein